MILGTWKGEECYLSEDVGYVMLLAKCKISFRPLMVIQHQEMGIYWDGSLSSSVRNWTHILIEFEEHEYPGKRLRE